jgi:hypothetical protein
VYPKVAIISIGVNNVIYARDKDLEVTSPVSRTQCLMNNDELDTISLKFMQLTQRLCVAMRI